MYIYIYLLHNLDTLTVTSGGNAINNGDTIDVVEEDDFNFTCSTSFSLVDIALVTDIDVSGSPSGSSRDFYLLYVHRNLLELCSPVQMALILSHSLLMCYVSL